MGTSTEAESPSEVWSQEQVTDDEDDLAMSTIAVERESNVTINNGQFFLCNVSQALHDCFLIVRTRALLNRANSLRTFWDFDFGFLLLLRVAADLNTPGENLLYEKKIENYGFVVIF